MDFHSFIQILRAKSSREILLPFSQWKMIGKDFQDESSSSWMRTALKMLVQNPSILENSQGFVIYQSYDKTKDTALGLQAAQFDRPIKSYSDLESWSHSRAPKTRFNYHMQIFKSVAVDYPEYQHKMTDKNSVFYTLNNSSYKEVGIISSGKVEILFRKNKGVLPSSQSEKASPNSMWDLVCRYFSTPSKKVVIN